jgi:polyisoprenoid-binding protein YceI
MTPDDETMANTSFLSDGSTSGTWRLESARSSVQFKSKSMWGLVAVKGAFKQFEGEVHVEDNGSLTGLVTVATDSLDTGNKKRDKHLRSDDFFDTTKYPEITFRLAGISPKGSQLDVAGTLTVNTTSLPISFPATVALTKDHEVGVTAETVIDRSDFGLTWNSMGMASMKNTITLHAVFVNG